jgi:HlyD family secretion protein
MWRLLTNRRVLQAAAIMGILLVVALWPEAIDVEVGNVTRGALVVSLTAQGDTRVHHRLVVAAPVAGTLEPIELELGNGVEAGTTVVARLHPDPVPPLDRRAKAEANVAVAEAKTALEEARAQEEEARAALDLATAELKREQERFDNGQTSQQSLEARRNIVNSAEETLNAAMYATAPASAAYDRARARLAAPHPEPPDSVLEILAPVDGVVLRRLHDGEGQVQPGDPLVEIGDPSHVEIVASLPVADAAKVKPGMRVDVEHWGGDTPLPAWVERVEASGARPVEGTNGERRQNVLIDFEDDREAWRAMGDGFRVEVRIAIWEEEDVRRVPVAALFKVGDQWAVYLVQSGRAHRTIVDIGERTDNEAEVRNGLRAGQQVVLNPPDTLTDNARVAVRGE